MSLTRSALAMAGLGTLISWRPRWTRRYPAQTREAISRDRKGLPNIDMGPREAARAAMEWLKRAQDCSASSDGGVSRHYSLVDGWATSYPETTGYIVPTLIEASLFLKDSELLSRARRMLDWLLSIQFLDGGFPGGRIDQNPAVPVTFNTGQILLGLAAGAKAFGDPKYLEGARRAARFLVDSQDADGAWRRNASPFAEPGEKSYDTHVAWSLFEAGRVAHGEGFELAGLRQVRWAISRMLPNGWFLDNCLDEGEPFTHTIGYALRGIIEAYRFSNDPQFLNAALRTSTAIEARLETDGRLAGRFDRNWRPAASFSCLTGSVQIAACWFLLGRITGEPKYEAFARRANAYVRRTVHIDGDPGTAGGVKGSHPIDGDYGRFQYLNWAAKFFIDSNLMELSLGADNGPAG